MFVFKDELEFRGDDVIVVVVRGGRGGVGFVIVIDG